LVVPLEELQAERSEGLLVVRSGELLEARLAVPLAGRLLVVPVAQLRVALPEAPQEALRLVVLAQALGALLVLAPLEEVLLALGQALLR
jgi:hypothetical protein